MRTALILREKIPIPEFLESVKRLLLEAPVSYVASNRNVSYLFLPFRLSRERFHYDYNCSDMKRRPSDVL